MSDGEGVYSIVLRIACGSAAGRVNDIVSMDNEGYIESHVEGETVVAEASASNLGTLLRTADDFIACVEVALSTIRAAGGNP
ncbi:MAG: hypothetical protein KIY12_02655 [Thermoplasmata archaeon]|uniref:Uncharacterized protein n=1 Tax=Candidatus Sysuiplasma superficiale TaxID=2823368 RepID=A0A8J8CBG3_9ARCH|nr:hypothetical protein [Candidatus Sysuiplasma superficiale]MBX8643615.1 hypothetical protein [Candidatus Sysuiplasma superficiale]MCL4347126.1 hypothetical protein [Candidatus Thermoplasmatota archaeon]MCL5437097.1 hypothetical protein [Candidatus Thermoplasmatota archaeon]